MNFECWSCGQVVLQELLPCPDGKEGCMVPHYPPEGEQNWVCPHCGHDNKPDWDKHRAEHPGGPLRVRESIGMYAANLKGLERLEVLRGPAEEAAEVAAGSSER